MHETLSRIETDSIMIQASACEPLQSALPTRAESMPSRFLRECPSVGAPGQCTRAWHAAFAGHERRPVIVDQENTFA